MHLTVSVDCGALSAKLLTCTEKVINAFIDVANISAQKMHINVDLMVVLSLTVEYCKVQLA